MSRWDVEIKETRSWRVQVEAADYKDAVRAASAIEPGSRGVARCVVQVMPASEHAPLRATANLDGATWFAVIHPPHGARLSQRDIDFVLDLVDELEWEVTEVLGTPGCTQLAIGVKHHPQVDPINERLRERFAEQEDSRRRQDSEST